MAHTDISHTLECHYIPWFKQYWKGLFCCCWISRQFVRGFATRSDDTRCLSPFSGAVTGLTHHSSVWLCAWRAIHDHDLHVSSPVNDSESWQAVLCVKCLFLYLICGYCRHGKKVNWSLVCCLNFAYNPPAAMRETSAVRSLYFETEWI